MLKKTHAAPSRRPSTSPKPVQHSSLRKASTAFSVSWRGRHHTTRPPRPRATRAAATRPRGGKAEGGGRGKGGGRRGTARGGLDLPDRQARGPRLDQQAEDGETGRVPEL